MTHVSHMGSLLSLEAHTRSRRYWVVSEQKGSLHSPFSDIYSPRTTKGCHTSLHGEAILLAHLFPHSPFSDLREGVTTPIGQRHQTLDLHPNFTCRRALVHIPLVWCFYILCTL